MKVITMGLVPDFSVVIECLGDIETYEMKRFISTKPYMAWELHEMEYIR